MKVPNKRKLLALNSSADIEFKDFMKLLKHCTKESFSFLVNDMTLTSDNPFRFTTNFL